MGGDGGLFGAVPNLGGAPLDVALPKLPRIVRCRLGREPANNSTGLI